MGRVQPATGRRLLVWGGSASFALAALHVLIIAIGAPAYAYFGRPDLAERATAGSLLPPLATLALTFLLSVWGVYAYSGARLIRRVPLLRTGLVTVSVIYLARGLVLLADVARWLSDESFPPRQAVFSAGALAIGVCYAIGTLTLFRKAAELM
jgi:hypothetical protein